MHYRKKIGKNTSFILIKQWKKIITMAKGKKTGGRGKGTPNKLTSELRGVLKIIIFQELENLLFYLDQLEPKARLEIIIKLIPFVLPKTHSINPDNDEPFNFNILNG